MHCGHVQRCLATPASAVLVVGWHLHGLVDGGEVLGIQQKGQDLGIWGRRQTLGKTRWSRRSRKPTRANEANGATVEVCSGLQRYVTAIFTKENGEQLTIMTVTEYQLELP